MKCPGCGTRLSGVEQARPLCAQCLKQAMHDQEAPLPASWDRERLAFYHHGRYQAVRREIAAYGTIPSISVPGLARAFEAAMHYLKDVEKSVENQKIAAQHLAESESRHGGTCFLPPG